MIIIIVSGVANSTFISYNFIFFYYLSLLSTSLTTLITMRMRHAVFLADGDEFQDLTDISDLLISDQDIIRAKWIEHYPGLILYITLVLVA